MMRTFEQILKDRVAKVAAHNISFSYYDSTVKPKYLNKRLRAFFLKNPHYTQNWCAVIVDAVRNKMMVDGFIVGNKDESGNDDPRQEAINTLWDSRNLADEMDTILEAKHATGEGFLVSGIDSNNRIVAYSNDPRAILVYYDGEDPNQMTQAVKFWQSPDGKSMATHWYYEGDKVIEQDYKSTTKDTEQTQVSAVYNTDGEPHTTNYPRIPVFHFRRSNRRIVPEFDMVEAIQDTINKAYVALGFMVERAANKLRIAITDADVSELTDLEPGDIGTIPPAPEGSQPVSVTEYGEANLSQMLAVIGDSTGAMAAITSTPRHYFTDSAGANISGEALQALESPLIAKVERYQRKDSTTLEDFAAFVLTLSGSPTSTDEVTCLFANPKTTLTKSQAETREINVRAGIPITTQVRHEGWRQNEIDQMLDDKAKESGAVMEQQQLEEAYDRLAERNAQLIGPMLQVALSSIADAALDEVTTGNRLERIVQAAGEATATAAQGA